jgi:hypothetical protein
MTTGRLSFSSAFPLGASVSSGLASNGANVLAAEGEIFKLEPRNKRLWIRTPEEEELFFYYTSETPVLGIGAGAGVEGLAPGSRKLLRVLYTQHAAIPKAVRIDVMKTAARTGPSRRPLR